MTTTTQKFSRRYAWLVVGILMLAYVFSFIDRMILNLMVGPIRADLGISDTQMSLLMGFSFAIFYTICGIPLGRLADTSSRRRLITLGIIVWSAMTAACGLARHYWQLFLFRIGVGVGEAALSPAAYSMIADYFPREQRATAISVYSMGIYIGSGLAFILGGLVVQWATTQGVIDLPVIGETRPWQLVFLVLGVAGVAFSLCFVAVREPERQGTNTDIVPIRDVMAYLWLHRRSVLSHNLGFSMIAIVGYGSASWIPSYMARSYGWSIFDIGLTYGLIIMLCGSAGIVFGGRLSDRWAARGKTDAAFVVSILAILLAAVFCQLFLWLPGIPMAITALAVWTFLQSMPSGLGPSAIQDMVPNRMRGQASALYLFIVNLIGLGIGPTAVALCTDYVFGDDQAVGYSLAIVCGVAALLAAASLAYGRSAYRDSVNDINQVHHTHSVR